MPADVHEQKPWNPTVCGGDGSVWMDMSQNTSVAAEQSEACRQIQDMTLLVPVVSTAKTITSAKSIDIFHQPST